MNKTAEKPAENIMDPWAEATKACFAAANFYAETVQACWTAGAAAMMETMQSSLETMPQVDELETRPASNAAASVASRVNSLTSTSRPAARSWYRPPIDNPFLSMVDDAMKPWRTMIPDYSGHPQHLSEADLFTPKGAAEIIAAYQSGSGFSMAQISFPDEKSVCLTMPAPWAMLTKP